MLGLLITEAADSWSGGRRAVKGREQLEVSMRGRVGWLVLAVVLVVGTWWALATNDERHTYQPGQPVGGSEPPPPVPS